jgi:large subunit ribosomal protein L22
MTHDRILTMAEARAVLRFVRVAPRKAKPVVDMIRGQQVPMALAMLKHLPRHAARVIEKVLRSAVANAEQKELGDSESMGRANAIQKRTSHITVVVEAPGIQGKSST